MISVLAQVSGAAGSGNAHGIREGRLPNAEEPPQLDLVPMQRVPADALSDAQNFLGLCADAWPASMPAPACAQARTIREHEGSQTAFVIKPGKSSELNARVDAGAHGGCVGELPRDHVSNCR
jgi:hypothetical protein